MPDLGLQLRYRDRHSAASTVGHWIIVSQGASAMFPPAGVGTMPDPVRFGEIIVGSHGHDPRIGPNIVEDAGWVMLATNLPQRLLQCVRSLDRLPRLAFGRDVIKHKWSREICDLPHRIWAICNRDKAKNIDINSVSSYSGCILKKSTKRFI